MCDGEQHAASCGAVEFGHCDARDTDGLIKLHRLGDRVLASARIKHQERLVGHGLVLLAHHPHDLTELIHQVGLVLKPPCGVRDQQIHIPSRGRLQCVKQH